MTEQSIEVIALKFIDSREGHTDVQTIFQPPTMSRSDVMRKLIFGAYIAADELELERQDLEEIIKDVLDAAYLQKSNGTIYTGPKLVSGEDD